MPDQGQTWFSVRIDEEKKVVLFVPHQISKLFRKSNEVVKVQRGSGTRIYKVVWMKVRDKSRSDIYFEKGWEDFVKDNGIEIGDTPDLLYQGDRLFKVLIWRDGIDITRYCIVISDSSDGSDLSDNDEQKTVLSQRTSTTKLPDTRRSKTPEFKVTFTKAYSVVGRMNVPLHFARHHFNRFGATKPATL